MTFLERRKFGGKTPSAFVGVILGIYVAFSVFIFLMPLTGSASDTAGLCDGNFPCYSPAACAKAGGAYATCPSKCDDNPNRGFCYANPEPVQLTVHIGSITEAVDIGAYIEAVYTYAIGVAAVLAAVMLMIGGVQWMTVTGDKGAAKKRISNAIVGLLLTVFAWVFLNTINPALVRLQMPRIPMIRQQAFVQCDEFKMEKACGHRFGLVENESAAEGATVTERYTMTDDVDSGDVMTECVGASCTLAGSEDGVNTCQQIMATATSESESDDEGDDADEEDSDDDSGSSECSGCASGYDCVACMQQGQSCTGIGPNSECCGRYCGFADTTAFGYEQIGRWVGSLVANRLDMQGTCHNGMHGTLCSEPNECIGSRCVDLTRWAEAFSWRTLIPGHSPILGMTAGGICMNGTAGAPCNSDEDCNGLACTEESGKYYCAPRVVGGFCVDSGDCPSGLSCKESGSRFCYGGTAVSGSGTIETATCSSGNDGDEQCEERYGEDYECMESGFSEPRCINGEPGSTCTEDAQCQINGRTGFCYDGAIYDIGDLGICVEGVDGNGCDDNEGCQSGVCFDNDGVGRICIGPNEAGGPCIPSRGGCVDGLTCHEDSHTCVPSS
ncbi:MAG: pilin [Patescibacteria group bacterium]|nr:pilin [Patescibacteria group bacterium]